MMRLDLELMGFDKNMIEALLTEYESEIEDVNHAVELLVRGPNGWWTHRYVKNPLTSLCRICSGYAIDHVAELNRA
jgi:hypothetical protein